MKFEITIKPRDKQAKELMPESKTLDVRGFVLTFVQGKKYATTAGGAMNINAVVTSLRGLVETLDHDQYEDVIEGTKQ